MSGEVHTHLPAHTATRAEEGLTLTCGRVRCFRQTDQHLGKRLRLSDEQPLSNEEIGSAYRIYLAWTGGTNDGAARQVRADEFARDRKDQVRLKQWVRFFIEIRKCQSCNRVG